MTPTPTPTPSPTICDSASRRSALQKLSCAALPGSAALGAGWPWPLRAATADARAQLANRPTGGTVNNPTSHPSPRLVTIGGGITEVVYALGAQALLVGTDTTSLHPPAALKTPKVGYMRQLSSEGMLALEPSALIAGTDAGPPIVIEQLRSAGVQIELIEATHNWREVQHKIVAVGRATAKQDQARRFLAALDTRWASVSSRIQRNARSMAPPKVLFVLSHTGSPLVAGEDTAAHAVIGFMGASNALSGFKGYRPMTAEAMAAAAPDLILTTSQGLEALGGREKFWQRPELTLTPAYQRRHRPEALIAVDALELLGFGPRLPEVIEALHGQWMQP